MTIPTDSMKVVESGAVQYKARRGAVGHDNGNSGVHQRLIAVLMALGLIFVAGHLAWLHLGAPSLTAASCSHEEDLNWGSKITLQGHTVNVSDYFISQVNEEDIKKYLFTLTTSPHIAGSEKNKELAVMIYEEWKQYEFDSVDIFNYSVLLSYPNASHPNTLTLKRADGELIYNSHIGLEPPLTPGEDNPDVAPPFNAFSGNGTVKGPLLYVNYGRQQDFQFVVNSYPQLNLSEYICIVRYGEIFRGDKAHLAQSFGCKGLLIFSDPYDYAPEGIPVYPDGPSLPEYGVQRGSLPRPNGDLLTPGYPALSDRDIYRRPYSEAEDAGDIPHIPVQPISYGDAVHFMQQLNDCLPPDDWIGGLNVIYRIAQNISNNNYTELTVNNYQEQRIIYNVVAKLYGSIEPDRQVILGNHRDAWVFGAVDPNSGTAALLNLAKVIGQLRHDHDWRPGRTLTLCSWDAEEYGMVGSTEWVEDYGKLLGATTMAYLNVDSAVGGTQFFSAQANPLMYEVLWQATSSVKSPNTSFATVYDEWLSYMPGFYNGMAKPAIGNLGSGSDFTAFLQKQGISCASMSYKNTTSYAVYHSVHDNFYWMTHFGDPSFSRHHATASVWIVAALLLSTTPLPPIDLTLYSWGLVEEATEIDSEYTKMLQNHGVSIEYMVSSALELGVAFGTFQAALEKMKASVDFSQQLRAVRIINDKMMNVERAFIRPEGLPGRPYYKHVVYAPSAMNMYNSSIFPGFYDALSASLESGEGWEEVKKQADILGTHFRYATQIVNDPSLQYVLKT